MKISRKSLHYRYANFVCEQLAWPSARNLCEYVNKMMFGSIILLMLGTILVAISPIIFTAYMMHWLGPNNTNFNGSHSKKREPYRLKNVSFYPVHAVCLIFLIMSALSFIQAFYRG